MNDYKKLKIVAVIVFTCVIPIITCNVASAQIQVNDTIIKVDTSAFNANGEQFLLVKKKILVCGKTVSCKTKKIVIKERDKSSSKIKREFNNSPKKHSSKNNSKTKLFIERGEKVEGCSALDSY